MGKPDQPATILAVDNDASTRRLLTIALDGDGKNRILTAGDVQSGLQLFSTEPEIDIVISDLNLPGISGIELIEKIRMINSAVPILVLSSLHSDLSLARALQSGADDYLQKPVDLKELRRSVSTLVTQYRHVRSQPGRAERAREARHDSSVVSMADGTYVELTAATDPQQAERFQRFAERLLATSLTKKEVSDLRLALEEMVRNAIEWGNRNNREKKLRLSYCLLPDRITFQVEDEGEGFDPSALQDPAADPKAHIARRKATGKRMGGWGVFLARKIMDEVTYNQKGNVVRFTKFIRRNTPPVYRAPEESASDA